MRKMKMESVSWTQNNPEYEKKEIAFEADVDQEENKLLNIYTGMEDQIWNGFGGAATESAGYVYSKLPEEKKKLFLEKYFGKNGLNYKTIRVPIDSCDFSLEQFEAGKDGSCEDFSMERAGKYILPLLEDIKAYTNNQISLFLSPWSPPVSFKDVDTRHAGGRLKKECYNAYALYLCRYIEEYESRGYKVKMLSIQNEAKAVQTWDSCVYTAKEEKDFLVNHLKPTLRKRNHEEILVFIWDHNKERVFDRANVTLSGEGSECADGMAFHWYSGDHFEMLDLFRKQFPNKKLILSESCLEYSILDVSNPFFNAAKIAHE
ncbi:MAG: glucosylceramidase, partial [Lachnospiraceae bacterium]|nr:glucosylceramidase [Lachnospiraceae bacterium]